MLLELDARDKNNWVTRVRMKLYEFGFGFVWLNQGVGDVNGFIRVFRKRLINCRWQNWNYHVQNSNRFGFYRLFRPLLCIPTYIYRYGSRQT